MNTRDLWTKYGMRAGVKKGAPYNEEFPDSDGWTVTLHLGRQQLTVPFYCGLGHKGAEPEGADVLDCLILDASGAEDRTFEDWCGDYGYDTDSRRAERTFKACQRIAKKLRAFLGEGRAEFMEAERL